MQQLLLVNPRKRRASRKPRSAAQKAATRRMLSANRSKRGSKRRTRHAAYASNPAPRRRRSSRSLVTRHVTRSRRRRNPISVRGLTGGITAMLKSAAFGAAGAIATDVAYGYVKGYLPAMVQSPVAADGGVSYSYYAAKGAAAIGLGMLLRRVIGAQKAGRMVEGSLTVTLHDMAKSIVGANMTSVQLGGYALNPGRSAGGALPASASPMAVSRVPGQLGKYISGTGQYISGTGTMRHREGVVR
jgi:hypothetical protein